MQNQERQVLELLCRLIAIDTSNPPGNEAALARLIAHEMTVMGLETSLRMLDGGRANVVGRIRGSGKKPSLVLLGHLDTVPPGESAWCTGPFQPVIRGGRVYGRGASDMKSGLAAMIVASGILAQRRHKLAGDLIFCATADEEAGGSGAKALLADGWLKEAGYLVLGEPTNLHIGIAEKGALWLEIVTTGKTAHGATPERGINAIIYMNHIINALTGWNYGFDSHALLGKPTLSLGTIIGGVKTNVVPDHCQLTLDVRTLPGQDHAVLLSDLNKLLHQLELQIPDLSVDVRVINERPPIEVNPDSPLVRAASEVGSRVSGKLPNLVGTSYYTDAAILTPVTGIPAVSIGPGDPGQAHQPDESVSVETLLKAIDFYVQLVKRLLE
ncbi:MAG: M20 family metallopeptidase [Firmicutes bacterium]|nr:M20 family metallopeptidase [Bacillota bacterium]